ncbi:MAG: 50S ribosomal protein L3 [Spirochaetota bacterium]
MIALIGKKHGMTQVFGEDGAVVPVTVIEMEENLVVAERTEVRNGYRSVLLGYSKQSKQRLNKADIGQFPEGVQPRAHLKEMRNFSPEYTLGQELGLEIFTGVRYVDVAGISKGKGFQGGMKRHGFGGGRKTHGSKFHRDIGSSGQAAWPSRTYRGRKMAGRMGAERTTVQNLEVIRMDLGKNLLVVRGAVPGPRGSYVMVRKAKKKS